MKTFFQKSISMHDVSDFRDNFAKLNIRNLQKVTNQRRRNFGSELYGFVKFVKIIIIVMSLLMPKNPRNFHKKLGQLKLIFCIESFSWIFRNHIVLNRNFDAVDLTPSEDF